MQKIANDISADFRTAKNIRLKWWGVLAVFVGTLLLAWVADNFGRLELVLPMVNAAAVLIFVIVVKTEFRRKLWFWIFMGMVAALHVALLLMIPLTARWVPAIAIAFIDSIDLLGILAALSLLSNVVKISR